MKKINYTGSSKVIIRLCEAVNDLIDGGGATVNDGVLTIQKNGTDVQTFFRPTSGHMLMMHGAAVSSKLKRPLVTAFSMLTWRWN